MKILTFCDANTKFVEVWQYFIYHLYTQKILYIDYAKPHRQSYYLFNLVYKMCAHHYSSADCSSVEQHLRNEMTNTITAIFDMDGSKTLTIWAIPPYIISNNGI